MKRLWSDKQKEYARNAHARWNFKIGAVRSGKTYVDIAYIIPKRLRELKDEKGLNVILGVSRETIERNVLQPMREIYTGTIVGNINSRGIAKVCGVDVYCLGAEKSNQVAKIQGASIKYCYGDEIAKWHPDVFAILQSRLDKKYSTFDGTCNPEYPTHWLKKFIDREDINSYVQKYTIFDNPFLPEEFVADLQKEYSGTVYERRYIQGEWALAEGLIYPMYEDAIDDVPAWKEGEDRNYCLSIDYGTMNAFAAALWENHDGVWYASRVFYYSGRDTGIQMTDEEYASRLDELLSDIAEYYEKKPGYRQKLETIIDPSAASFIALLNKRSLYKVRKGDNNVLDGIRETASAIRMGRIKIDRNIKEWQEEAGGYAWEDTDGTERPIKVNDHLCDAVRYFVKTKGIARKNRTQPGYTPRLL